MVGVRFALLRSDRVTRFSSITYMLHLLRFSKREAFKTLVFCLGFLSLASIVARLPALSRCNTLSDGPPNALPSLVTSAVVKVVFARKAESLNWIGYLSRRETFQVTVYNDGDPMEDQVLWRGIEIKIGDGVPGEASKYVRFIIEHYESLHEYKYIVFSQGEPFVHSPDFIGLLDELPKQIAPFLPLTYRAYPSPWGPFKTFEEELDTGWFVNGYRVWCDTMDTNIQGSTWHDKWLDEFKKANGFHTLEDLWVELKIPFSVPSKLIKMYSAIFAVSPHILLKFDKTFWNEMYAFLLARGKDGAVKLEYLWLPMFEAAAAA